MEYEPHIIASLRTYRWGADLPKGDSRMVRVNAMQRLGLVSALPQSQQQGIVVRVELTAKGRAALGMTKDDR